MTLVDRYIEYVANVRRYSDRTATIYREVLEDFASFAFREDGTLPEDVPDSELLAALNPSEIRSYEVGMLDSRGLTPRTVNLHLSVLSGFCRFLVKSGHLSSNPVRLVPRPKSEKRLPVFYRKESMDDYFAATQVYASADMYEILLQCIGTRHGRELYDHRLARLIIAVLYSLGIRRAELVGLNISDVDFGRNVVRVHGKGDKMREIPLIASLSEEILLYLKAVEALVGGKRSLNEPLLVTYSGRRLYPVYVDRVVKSELGGSSDVTGRKSPHVLRHSLATELLNGGTDLNSIKELLGHSSLSATQVYTHNTIAKLKSIYESAHPRAKNGGKNGD
ncbi:MAG: tyrosine-type recombinase/integrase [Candidatus Cryptobacteroides sp.]